MRGPTLAFGVFVLFNACSVMQAYSSVSPPCDAGAGPGAGCSATQVDAGVAADTGTGQSDYGCSGTAAGYGDFGNGSSDATYGGPTSDATYFVGDDCGAGHDMDADATGPDASGESSVDGTVRDAADGDAGEASVAANVDDDGAADGEQEASGIP